MSGHSKWSTIKRKKGAKDAERGKLFTKLIKEITVAARSGGDESGNARLRTAILNARSANMPNATIERAVRRGTGEEPGVVYEEVLYEGYGPGGVAVIVEGLTDNKNRTVSDVRHIFSKYNGNLAEKGSVAWMFAQKGVIEVAKTLIGEDELMLLVLDAGAEDMQDGGEVHEIVVPLPSFEAVKQVLEEKRITSSQASLAWLPQNMLAVESKDVMPIINLLEALEENDDVQKVYSNFDAPEADLQRLLESA